MQPTSSWTAAPMGHGSSTSLQPPGPSVLELEAGWNWASNSAQQNTATTRTRHNTTISPSSDTGTRLQYRAMYYFFIQFLFKLPFFFPLEKGLQWEHNVATKRRTISVQTVSLPFITFSVTFGAWFPHQSRSLKLYCFHCTYLSPTSIRLVNF